MNRRAVLAGGITALAGCQTLSRRTDSTPAQSEVEWRQIGRDETHRSVAPDGVIPEGISRHGAVELSGARHTSPVGDSDRVVACDERGLAVYPLDEAVPSSHVDLPGTVPRCPAIDDDRVVTTRYVTDTDTAVVVSVADRTVEWTRQLPGRVVLAPAVTDGTVYTGTDESYVALEASTGAIRWQTDDGISPSRWDRIATANLAPAVTDDTVVVSRGRGVVSVDRSTGARNWEYDGGRVFSAPAIDERTVYVPEKTGLTALAVETGDRQWRLEADGAWPTPAVGDDHVVTGTTGGLVTVDRETGARVDTLSDPFSSVFPSGVGLVGGEVLTGSQGHGAFLVGVDNGAFNPDTARRFGAQSYYTPAFVAGRVAFVHYGQQNELVILSAD